MYQANPYKPFPSELRGDEIGGAVCETILDNGKFFRYVIIRPKELLSHRVRDLILNNYLSLDAIYSNAKDLLGREAKRDAPWLYVVESFVVANEFQGTQTDIADHAIDFREHVFDDINEAIDFCKREFNIEEKDFQKEWETNYPQN